MASTITTNATTKYRVTKIALDFVEGHTRVLYARWSWSTSFVEDTEHIKVEWYYTTAESVKDGITTWIPGETQEIDPNDGTAIDKHKTGYYSEYTAKENAITVKVVITPITKTDDRETDDGTVQIKRHYNWASTTDADWIIVMGDGPEAPGSPTVTIDGTTLTAKVTGLDRKKTPTVKFRIAKDEIEDYLTSEYLTVGLYDDSVTHTCTVDAGAEYKVQAIGYDPDTKTSSDWSNWSEPVESAPTSPIITNIVATGDKSIQVTWDRVNGIKKYTLQAIHIDSIPDEYKYSTLTELFTYTNINKEELTTPEISSDDTNTYISYGWTLSNGLPGEYYIRVLALNSNNTPSKGSELMEASLKTFIIGTKPTAPTTWSSVSTAVVGESIELCWLHNSEDNSKVNKSELFLLFGTGVTKTYTIGSNEFQSADGLITAPIFDPDEDTTRICYINTSLFEVGSTIQWKVRTAGAKVVDGEPEYGEYSIERTFNIYAKPSLSLRLLNAQDESLGYVENLDRQLLRELPFKIAVNVGETYNQHPTSYYVKIVSQTKYETLNNMGEETIVNPGTVIYSKVFNTNTTLDNVLFDDNKNMVLTLSANHISLVNNIECIVYVTVGMSSGITVEASNMFMVGWDETMPEPGASVTINTSNYTATIMAFITNDGEETDLDPANYRFSIYRRDYNGDFIEIGSNLEQHTYVTDPHPSLDYARYRIVCQSLLTSIISYIDLPNVPVGVKSIVIQWDEPWQSYEAVNKNSYTNQTYGSSMLVLPYNIKVDDSFSKDVKLVNYIGRERSVAYYGTHKDHTSTWNTEIPKTDDATLYAIRRLAEWMGNVYVREPSGTGYWATISINYSKSYSELTIPITINITRVEGGM